MKSGFTETFQAIDDGFSYSIRPIQKDDGQKIIRLFEHLSPENRYLRFAHAISKLPDAFLEDILELDYQQEMALVACINESTDHEEIIGISRYVSDDSGKRCEFSISVSDQYSAHGVGMNLMNHLITYAQKQDLIQMIGYILSNNTKMLHMVRELGFEIDTPNDDHDFKIATLQLQK